MLIIRHHAHLITIRIANSDYYTLYCYMRSAGYKQSDVLAKMLPFV